MTKLLLFIYLKLAKNNKENVWNKCTVVAFTENSECKLWNIYKIVTGLKMPWADFSRVQ